MTAWQAGEEQGGLPRLEAAERRARRSYEYFREAARAGGRRGAEEGDRRCAGGGGSGTRTAGLRKAVSVMGAQRGTRRAGGAEWA